MKTDNLFKSRHIVSSNQNYIDYFVLSIFIVFVAVVFSLIKTDRVDNSINTNDYTSVNDKLSCVRQIYLIHLSFCYLTFLSGLFAIISRILSYILNYNYWNVFHLWCGRIYILSMIWTISTSTLIRNEGLPLGTLISFLWVLSGLTFGYVIIKLNNKTKFSKLLHGSFMVTSWFGIAGRIFNYNSSKDFTCYTYPIYKTNHSLLPASDLHYNKYPWANQELWGWGLPLLIGPFFGTMLSFYYIIKI